MHIAIDIYYSKRFSKNVSYVSELTPLLSAHGFNIHARDVGESDQWKTLGLKSVPAIVMTADGAPVYNIVSYEPPESALNRLQNRCDELERGLTLEHEPAASTGTPPTVASDRLLAYYIESSSGAHRYERWNEELLKHESTTNGWCCPGRSDHKEFVIFHLTGPASVETLLLLPRSRSDGTDPHKSFPKSLSLWMLDDNKTEFPLWQQENIQLHDTNAYFSIQLNPPQTCSRLKLVVEDKHDIDGKSFPSIAGVKILGTRLDQTNGGYFIKSSGKHRTFDPRLFVKTGLFAADNLCVERYNLLQDQHLPSSVGSKYKLIIAIEGGIGLSVDETAERTLELGDLAIVEPWHAFSIRGTRDENAALVIFNSEELESVWESR